MSNAVIRYSDAELAEFKALIDKKMEQTKENLEGLQAQILEITENTSDEHGGDWVDDSSINNEVEMLNNMAIRQRRYLKDLENALIRIQNKTYGICVITGELIDKKRLMAVPTTTKSLSAKTESQNKTIERPKLRPKPKPSRPAEKKIISKVIRKPAANAPKPILSDDDDDDLDFDKDLFLDDDVIKASVDDLDDLTDDQDADMDEDDDNDLFIKRRDDEEDDEDDDMD
jgi:RNA polymerase-binding transcription factor DksA